MLESGRIPPLPRFPPNMQGGRKMAPTSIFASMCLFYFLHILFCCIGEIHSILGIASELSHLFVLLESCQSIYTCYIDLFTGTVRSKDELRVTSQGFISKRKQSIHTRLHGHVKMYVLCCTLMSDKADHLFRNAFLKTCTREAYARIRDKGGDRK